MMAFAQLPPPGEGMTGCKRVGCGWTGRTAWSADGVLRERAPGSQARGALKGVLLCHPNR